MNSTIFGRIGRDAELKHTQNGLALARFSVALNVYSKEKDSQATWVQATIFGNMAESLVEYLTKGTAVALSGDLKLREYESDNGSGVSLDMAVNSVALLGGGSSEEKPAPKNTKKPEKRATDIDDSDIPF